jgi:hypothetical protein
VTAQNIDTLIEGLFALQEPWRGRFLTLLADRVEGWMPDDRPPTREEIAAWLNDLSLYREIALLLSTWQRSRI